MTRGDAYYSFGVFAAVLFYDPLGITTLESIAETFTDVKYLKSSEVYNRGDPWALFIGPCVRVCVCACVRVCV